jgi:hydroxymethylpyrimidine/phosphomethylpyrimidine kinase
MIPRGRPAVLVIAGTDSSGGAGLTRDVQVLTDFGVDVLCAVTAVTAQSNSAVTAVHPIAPEVIHAQITAALATRPIAAVKIGMLGNRATVEAVVSGLLTVNRAPVVLDPVLLSSSGSVLLDAEGRAMIVEKLFPLTTLVTPNVPEIAALLNEQPATTDEALMEHAVRLLALGPPAVLLKGGHAEGPEAVDLLVAHDGTPQRIAAPRVRANRRGTGCALASAIAARLASGETLFEACRQAKHYVLEMLRQRE